MGFLVISQLRLLLWLTFTVFLPGEDQITALEVVQKADDKRRGDTNYSEMSITIVRPSWEREIQIKAWSQGTEFSLILITDPARDRGTTFLKRNNEIWNWVPAIERNIKLPPSMMMQSWMGSDFTNDDLIKESSNTKDYNHRMIGDSVVMGLDCYKIELIPKPDAPVVWGKIYSWIDKNDFMELKTELYDEEGYLVNRVLFSEIELLDGRLLPSKMEYIPVDKQGFSTVIKYHSVDYDIDLSEGYFTLQNMKRVR